MIVLNATRSVPRPWTILKCSESVATRSESRLNTCIACYSISFHGQPRCWTLPRRIGGIAFHQDAIEALRFGNRCRSAGIFPVVACTSTKSQGLTSASNRKLITHLADFSVQEVNFEHIF